MTETGPLPVSSAAWLALGVTRAIAALHEAGLAHQAITPSNVLLEPGGPVLTDFGLSRVALTDGSQVAADDMFMLGLTIFCAATGRLPWGGYPSSPVPPPQARGDPDLTDCPPALLSVVTSCLDPDPGQRPAAAGLLDRLIQVAGPPPRSWLPAAVAARFADYQAFPQPPATRRRRFRLRFSRGTTSR